MTKTALDMVNRFTQLKADVIQIRAAVDVLSDEYDSGVGNISIPILSNAIQERTDEISNIERYLRNIKVNE